MIRPLVLGVAGAASVAGLAGAQVLVTGPSSSASPYAVNIPGGPVLRVVSILTVGDTVGGYQLLGIPDGMGAFNAADGTFSMFVNHELTATASGKRHAHQPEGFAGGAYISQWQVDPSTFAVSSGRDAMLNCLTVSNGSGGSLYNFARFCSGDVPEVRALFNAATGKGTQNRFYLCGEESSSNGRMIATDLDTGDVHQMVAFDASLGAWENGLARPLASDTTVVIGTSDGAANRIFVYVGTKQDTGNPAERAGLMNGISYGIQVQRDGTNLAAESRDFCFGNAKTGPIYTATFTLAPGGTAAGTSFLRPEDGAWDPANPNDFYVVCTDRMQTATQVGRSRLFRIRFNDVDNMLAGGTIEALLDGTDVMEMGDNLCVSNDVTGGTRVVLTEDPGNNDHAAKILVYTVANDSLQVVARADQARFGDVGVPATAPFNRDEEISGIIDARETLGEGWFIFNMQAHYTLPDPLVEGGQLLAMYAPGILGSCAADVASPRNGQVGPEDLTALLAAWGQPGATDVNLDGTTDGADLAAMLAAWGNCGS
jgi:hypothetical protein